MTYATVVLLAVLLALAGSAVPLRRWTLRFLAGSVIYHLLLTIYDFTGIPWSRASLIVPLLLLAGWGLWKERPRPGLSSDLGWGEGAAFFALASFAAFAPTLWTATSDFVFHWGIKGHRFFLARGVDYAWLAKDWNWVLHPDYPNLLPELFAGGALLAGRFAAPAQMLWSVLFFGMALASAREALRQPEIDRSVAQTALACIAFALAAVGIGHRMAGAADWMPALALLASLPALLRPPDPQGDLEVGIAAAFAAASKMEGMPLAVFLLGIQFLRGIAASKRIDFKSAARLGLPTAAVAISWAIRTFSYGLYQKFNTGTFDPGRARQVLHGLAEASAWKGSWHGLTLLLLALPFLLLPRRTRSAAAVASLQLLFYLWIYFSAAVDTEYQVITSFPRLAMHLIPVVIVLGAIPPSLPRFCSRSICSRI